MELELSKAFARGQHDGETNRLEVDSGRRGAYPKNKYPSNPYNQAALTWECYNEGWNSVGVFS